MNTNSIAGLIVVAMGLYQPLWAATEANKPKGPPPAPVQVAEVVKQPMSPTIWVPGTVTSRTDARLAAETPGRLIWVEEVGQRIAEGDVVARLEDTQQQLQVAELEAEVAKVKAQLVFLRQEVKRLSALAKQNNAAKNRLEQAQADRDVARGELKAARARLNLARDRVARSTIKAPFSGIVTERLKHRGEWVSNGESVIRLLDDNALEIQARVPISSMTYVRTGQELRIKTDNRISQGSVRTLVPVGDERSRLLDLRLEFQEPWPVGQSVRVAVPTAASKHVLALPRDALVLRRSGTSVFKINDKGSAEQVVVNTGVAEGNLIEVSGALQQGDKVVIRGGERLRPGQPVKILAGANP